MERLAATRPSCKLLLANGVNAVHILSELALLDLNVLIQAVTSAHRLGMTVLIELKEYLNACSLSMVVCVRASEDDLQSELRKLRHLA